MLLENQISTHFSLMNSPQPLSASQRGAKKLHSPFFCLQEKGAGGLSTCIFKLFQSFYYRFPILIKFNIVNRFKVILIYCLKDDIPPNLLQAGLAKFQLILQRKSELI
jgi:hypothetical protein